MEILHLISKETGGQFKVAYFNSDGKLLEVLRGTAKNFPTRDVDYLHSSATDFLGDLQFQSELHKSANDFSNSRNGQFLQLYNNQRSHVASIGDQLQLNKSQFGDLKIPIKHHHNSIDDSKIELQQKQLVNFLLNTSQHPSSEWNKSNSEMAEFLKLSHQLNAEGQLLHEMNDEKMEEIKQMFAKFYLEKTQQHPKSKHSRKFKALKGKTFEFPLEEHYHKHKKKSSRSKSARKSSRKRNSSTSSSTSSSSSSSSDSSDTERKSRLKALQNWTPPTAFVYPTSHAGSGDVWTRLHQGLPITNRYLMSKITSFLSLGLTVLVTFRPKTATRPTTARSTVSSAHSETKKVWRPPTRPSSGFITEGLRRPPTAAKQSEEKRYLDLILDSSL